MADDSEVDEIAESRWPRFMERCSIAWPLSLGAIATGAAAALNLAAHTWQKWLLFAIVVIAAAGALLLSLAREHRSQKLQQAIDRRRIRADEKNQSVIDGQLSPVLQLVAELIATENPATRRTTAGEVRSALVVAASVIVGSANVRANLFELEYVGGVPSCMRPRLFHGRGQKSQRVFRPGDPTMERTLAGQYRFVSQVDPGMGLAYETYLTHPITDGTTVYGVLTVDAPRTGDLSEDRDINIVRVLATITATAYAACKGLDS
jgi:hypothetical protein